MRILRSFTQTALALLSACGQVQIQDQIFYGTKGIEGSVEFHTLTTAQRDLTMEQWMEILRTAPLVCSSVNTFAQDKADYEKLCSFCRCCSYNTTAAVEQFFTNIKNAEGMANENSLHMQTK